MSQGNTCNLAIFFLDRKAFSQRLCTDVRRSFCSLAIEWQDGDFQEKMFILAQELRNDRWPSALDVKVASSPFKKPTMTFESIKTVMCHSRQMSCTSSSPSS